MSCINKKAKTKKTGTRRGQTGPKKPKAKPYTIQPDVSPEIVIETWKNSDNKIVSGAKEGPKNIYHQSSSLQLHQITCTPFD